MDIFYLGLFFCYGRVRVTWSQPTRPVGPRGSNIGCKYGHRVGLSTYGPTWTCITATGREILTEIFGLLYSVVFPVSDEATTSFILTLAACCTQPNLTLSWLAHLLLLDDRLFFWSFSRSSIFSLAGDSTECNILRCHLPSSTLSLSNYSFHTTKMHSHLSWWGNLFPPKTGLPPLTTHGPAISPRGDTHLGVFSDTCNVFVDK